jgi:EAL domain-containing protein (putative c-di-GMP-specific phosphodiesterase class I)/ActR/RegA family two-component response regulator
MSAPLLPLRVLAIDDHPIILRTLGVVLGGLGITAVDTAESIDAAESKLGEGTPYDLVICDLNLPGRDGIEFLRGKKQSLANSGVILLSGEDERILHSVTAMGRAAGLNVLAALSKPATPAKLQDALLHLDDIVPGRRKAPAEKMPTPKHLTEMLSGGMLAMHFQPRVRLSDRAFVGVEALLRGHHPELGDVAPMSIIQSADAQDRAGEVTRFILETSIAAAGRFHADGLQITTSINVDGAALRQQLPDMVSDLASREKLPIANLSLEIAEPALAVDYVNALEVTTRMRLKRCALALDQFGTGVSSVRQLQDLPFTELKIDRSFVTSCDTRAASRRMITACVGLARALGMQTTAVGVETEGEWKAVKEFGVDFAQGAYISDAHVQSQIADWTTEWSAG